LERCEIGDGCEYYESSIDAGCRGQEDVLERSTFATGSISSLGGCKKMMRKCLFRNPSRKNNQGGDALLVLTIVGGKIVGRAE
jgi:hypothetical protein